MSEFIDRETPPTRSDRRRMQGVHAVIGAFSAQQPDDYMGEGVVQGDVEVRIDDEVQGDTAVPGVEVDSGKFDSEYYRIISALVKYSAA